MSSGNRVALLIVGLIANAMTGCYRSHTRLEASDVPVDAARPDASRRDTPTEMDAPDELDAPDEPLDARFSCPADRPQLLCAEDVLFPAMRSFPLRFTFVQDTCGGGLSRCAVRVEGETLHISTELCPPPPAPCVPRGSVDVECNVPPLPPARYRVVVNGAPATEIDVDFDSRLVPGPRFCTTLASVDESGTSAPLPGIVDRTDEVCVGDARFDGPTMLELRDGCAECPTYDGTCTVTVEPRTTDDLPQGGEIRVYPRIFEAASEGPCEPSCEEHVRRCAVPSLTEGEYYRVWFEDEPRPSFGWVVGDGEDPACGAAAP